MSDLDFTRYEAVQSVTVMSSAAAITSVVASVGVFAIVAALSARLGESALREESRLASLRPSLRALVVLTLVSLLLVQLLGAIDVYVQTRVIHASAAEYFAYLSLGRLVGTSHAHLFGYTLLYGLVALFACLTAATPRLKAWLVALLLWSGPFDIAAWWAMKYLDARFEWLAMATAIASVGASFVTLALVAREMRRS